MKIILIILSILICLNNFSYAVEFDTSIDEKIRKEYNLKDSSEESLPALPSVVPTAETIIPAKTDYQATGKTYTLKSGTKITVASQKSVNDGYKKGSKIGFVTQNNIITKEGTTIPAGTIIKAVVTDSHGPQITGNGGLIELKFNEIYFNGIMSPLESNVKKANYKKVFFNNIKGERRYWKNWSKAMKPGIKTYKATKKASNAIRVIPVISLVPELLGMTVYTVNFVISPIVMIFFKGGSISLPAGTIFEIKIKDNIEIRG